MSDSESPRAGAERRPGVGAGEGVSVNPGAAYISADLLRRVWPGWPAFAWRSPVPVPREVETAYRLSLVVPGCCLVLGLLALFGVGTARGGTDLGNTLYFGVHGAAFVYVAAQFRLGRRWARIVNTLLAILNLVVLLMLLTLLVVAGALGIAVSGISGGSGGGGLAILAGGLLLLALVLAGIGQTAAVIVYMYKPATSRYLREAAIPTGPSGVGGAVGGTTVEPGMSNQRPSAPRRVLDGRQLWPGRRAFAWSSIEGTPWTAQLAYRLSLAAAICAGAYFVVNLLVDGFTYYEVDGFSLFVVLASGPLLAYSAAMFRLGHEWARMTYGVAVGVLSVVLLTTFFSGARHYFLYLRSALVGENDETYYLASPVGLSWLCSATLAFAVLAGFPVRLMFAEESPQHVASRALTVWKTMPDSPPTAVERTPALPPPTLTAPPPPNLARPPSLTPRTIFWLTAIVGTLMLPLNLVMLWPALSGKRRVENLGQDGSPYLSAFLKGFVASIIGAGILLTILLGFFILVVSRS